MKNICTLEGCEDNQKGFGYCNRHYKKFKRYGDATYSAFDRTPRERFWARVDKSGECWIWTGNVRPDNGYGSFAISSDKKVLTHRFAYEDLLGPIPEGMFLDHICHVKSCCNPRHLRVATPKQNVENQAGPQRNSRLGRGVHRDRKSGKYSARVLHYGTQHHVGGFTTREQAAEAAKQMRIRLFTHNDLDRRTA